MKQIVSRIAAMAMTACVAAAAGPAMAQEDVVIVYDASGSMWGQIDGTSKIEIARDVLGDLVTDWDDNTNLGLVAYGHRAEGDCTDIETMVAPGPLDRAAFIAKVNAINPVGKTPISASVSHAADLLSYRDNPATVVLISDGVETCNADPCALSAQLAKQGVAFTVHVVGFDLDDAANASLSCIAENTGGVFLPASNAAELTDALAQVQSAMVLKPVTPEPVAEEPALPEVTLTGPQQVTTGAVFDVAWSKTINARDYITIVPMGSDPGTSTDYIRAKTDTAGKLTAPAETGLYELRYVLDTGAVTLASAPIEVVEAEVGISGPGVVRAGTEIDVTWSSNVNARDFITIVPMGADEGSYADYIRVNSVTQGKLTAPDTTGLYELRYVLDKGARTLASAPLEVVGADAPLDDGAGLSVPATAAPGETITVTWALQSDSADQRIALARKDQPDFSWISVQSIGDVASMQITLPEETGLYEVRFLDVAGGALLGRSVVEVK
ncbi:VWA domain-containing protein [Primorskyibacter flagellatus]|uniref:VWA domain-containing protein n=1 Tax=Primorskyibacter flagellatus TaxID=1387277 RepID=UPI003A8CEA9C